MGVLGKFQGMVKKMKQENLPDTPEERHELIKDDLNEINSLLGTIFGGVTSINSLEPNPQAHDLQDELMNLANVGHMIPGIGNIFED